MISVSSTFTPTALAVAGLFSVALGVWHLGVPRWFDFAGALRGPVSTLRPLRMGPFAHRTTRSDVLGLGWVMSNAASYVLISVGVADLAAPAWLGTRFAPLIGGWIAGWWALRAASQLALGRRRLDVVLIAVFLGIAGVHIAAAAV
jgi:hypothetical protein